jgi:hypothetical protein
MPVWALEWFDQHGTGIAQMTGELNLRVYQEAMHQRL